jgi:hypothetical protein
MHLQSVSEVIPPPQPSLRLLYGHHVEKWGIDRVAFVSVLMDAGVTVTLTEPAERRGGIIDAWRRRDSYVLTQANC